MVYLSIFTQVRYYWDGSAAFTSERNDPSKHYPTSVALAETAPVSQLQPIASFSQGITSAKLTN